jgi:hypothetical protein
MQMETKYLHLRDSVECGTRFGDWQVCWIPGIIHYVVYGSETTPEMFIAISLSQSTDSAAFYETFESTVEA